MHDDARVREVAAALRAGGSVFAEDEARILLAHAAEAQELAGAVARRTAGEPLEHIVGWVDFAGIRVHVSPGVFVPRRRSELLVSEAARRAPRGAVVVDLCCGSGAIGAALASRRPDVTVHSTDVDGTAVAVARCNMADLRAFVYLGDMDASLPAALTGAADVVVACAPYVPTDAIALMPGEARDHEPRLALDGGPDGAALQRQVAAAASRLLRPGGTLIVETSDALLALTTEACTAAGLTTRVARLRRVDGVAVIAVA